MQGALPGVGGTGGWGKLAVRKAVKSPEKGRRKEEEETEWRTRGERAIETEKRNGKMHRGREAKGKKYRNRKRRRKEQQGREDRQTVIENEIYEQRQRESLLFAVASIPARGRRRGRAGRRTRARRSQKGAAELEIVNSRTGADTREIKANADSRAKKVVVHACIQSHTVCAVIAPGHLHEEDTGSAEPRVCVVVTERDGNGTRVVVALFGAERKRKRVQLSSLVHVVQILVHIARVNVVHDSHVLAFVCRRRCQAVRVGPHGEKGRVVHPDPSVVDCGCLALRGDICVLKSRIYNIRTYIAEWKQGAEWG